MCIRDSDEVGSWKRTEMQLRDEKAHAFAMAFQARPLEIGEPVSYTHLDVYKRQDS